MLLTDETTVFIVLRNNNNDNTYRNTCKWNASMSIESRGAASTDFPRW